MTTQLPTSVADPLLRCGDCVTLMRELGANSVDAVVDDPPAGVSFMGRKWDDKRGHQAATERGREVAPMLEALGLAPWQAGFVAFMVDCHVEAFRVLKPGAYMVTWALPRTQDLAGMALRLAGFDVVHAGVHLFGGGFPKSHNVSKALDKMAGAEREEYPHPTNACPGGEWCKCDMRDEPSQSGGTKHPAGSGPATDAAKRWDGHGTMLAPGHEIWHVSRKPTPLTYAKNVLEHGCGALNIEAVRVPRGDGVPKFTHRGEQSVGVYGDGLHGSARSGESSGGSWPRDVLLSRGGDQCPVEGIDRQAPNAGSWSPAGATYKSERAEQAVYGAMHGNSSPQHDGLGGASRFFSQFDQRVYYGPKNRDRRKGLLHGDHKHPTPKHPDLMRWLQRLVVPTAKATGGLPGVVLSRFLGSGTDGVAAVAEGFRFIGFELDEGHFEVARSRIMAAIGSPEAAAEANEQAPEGAQLGLL